MKRSLFVLCAIFLAQSVFAQDWAKERLNKSPRHGEWVDLRSGDRTIKAFVVYPERKEKTPVVIVIHEIFGLTEWVRGVCDQLAENGVIAIAPDLLSGQTFADGDLDGPRKAVSALSTEQVQADLDATSDYAFSYANVNPKLKAAYSFYGPTPDDPSKVANIPCPVFGFYGENDERINATIPKVEQLMKAAGKKYEPVIYKGAGHGFMREGEMPNANEANKKARDDAWARWKTLLKQLP